MFFRDEVAQDLSGPTRADVWNLVVLRSSTEEPAIRYLAVAVAAVKKYQATSGNLEISHRHRRFAMQQYARALKSIQIVLNTQRQEDGIRISLLASLLVFCFENVLGEHEQAIRQIKSALNLMERRLSMSKTKYRQRRNIPSSALAIQVLILRKRFYTPSSAWTTPSWRVSGSHKPSQKPAVCISTTDSTRCACRESLRM